MLLSDLLAGAAGRFPDKDALVFPGDRIFFGALDDQSGQVATRLRRLGIGPGDRVAILYENAPAAAVFFWGVLKTGAQTVDIPVLVSAGTIESILQECNPAALVVSERQFQKLVQKGIPEALPRLLLSDTELAHCAGIGHLVAHSLGEICAAEKPDRSRPAVRESDVAMVIYTSGTSGEPKGVMLSHENLISNLCAANTLMHLSSNDSILVVVPLYFIHGRMQLLLHALIGGTVAFSAGFQLPQKVLQELADYHVTGFSGVPYHFITLLDRKTLLPNLRYVLVTGGSISPESLRELSDALPGVAIHLAYGQTEASPRITYLGPSEILMRAKSVGRPLPGVRVEIVAEDGSTLCPGDVGEIVASGPNIMCGYVSQDEKTSQKIDAQGRLHTGDMGKMDADGYLYLVGRKSEMIKCAGERIFPREIEGVIERHPAILQSGVIGVPDRVLGEKIVACVVARPGLAVGVEEIRGHCLQFLSFVRAPREIRFFEELPKTSSGKIDRRGLVALWGSLRGQAGRKAS